MNDRQFKMGSLFDGSGGFPLASMLCGIEPVWASEIEPFPIKVTRARFPDMKHYGDISKIDVNDIETVDLISGGSPCQDMSVAGKRQGMSKQCPKCDYKVVGNEEIKECPECGTELEYTRSGLFMEQIRIVKEMRKKDELEQLRSGRTDEHIRPRFMLWENVTGAFSSNKGEDFRAVLEETAKIKDPTATIPRPPKGKWNNSGLIVGDGYSIAWRVLDAQYWGVPQRRRRIALVADFGGQCAGEILFKRNGLSRNFTQSKQAWQGTSGYSAQSIGKTGTSCIAFEPGAASRVGSHIYENQCGTLRANMGDNQFAVAHGVVSKGNGECFLTENKHMSLSCGGGQGGNGIQTGLYLLPKEPIAVQKDLYCMATQQGGAEIMNDLAPTITAAAGMSGNNQPVINQQKKVYGICSYDSNSMKSDNPHSGFYEAETSRTLDLNGGNPACNQGGIAICEPIAYSLQGNMIGREDHNGPQGIGVNEDVAFTLNATDRHAVVYEEPMDKTYQKTTGPLMANSHPGSYTGQDAHNDMFVANEYIVRRLTPLECSRLQGFPDWWCDNLQIEKPNGHDIAFWREVFETHREIVTGASKPKTDKQIVKWLKEEPNDGAMYKMWGNGISLPCFLYVIEGIKEVLERTSNSNSSTTASEEI